MVDMHLDILDQGQDADFSDIPESPEAVNDVKVKAGENFDISLIKKYPKSQKRVPLFVGPVSVREDRGEKENSSSTHISPHGIEFKTEERFNDGDLVKIQVNIPDFWKRKQKFVNYTRIDCPENFRILAKVVKTDILGKNKKKQLVTVQTLVIDSVDEQVLEEYIKGGA